MTSPLRLFPVGLPLGFQGLKSSTLFWMIIPGCWSDHALILSIQHIVWFGPIECVQRSRWDLSKLQLNKLWLLRSLLKLLSHRLAETALTTIYLQECCSTKQSVFKSAAVQHGELSEQNLCTFTWAATASNPYRHDGNRLPLPSPLIEMTEAKLSVGIVNVPLRPRGMLLVK